MARSGEGDLCLLRLTHLLKSFLGRHLLDSSGSKESFEQSLSHWLLSLGFNLCKIVNNWRLTVFLDLDAVGQGNEGEGCERESHRCSKEVVEFFVL